MDEALLTNILIIVLALWLLGLTFFTLQAILHYRKLVGKAKKDDLGKILDKILNDGRKNSKSIAQLEKELSDLNRDGTFHIQKIGIERFSPFSETGGDQSFCLAVMDGTDSGFVVTGLHARERTRIYIKELKKGVSKVDLSKEEEKAVSKARKT